MVILKGDGSPHFQDYLGERLLSLSEGLTVQLESFALNAALNQRYDLNHQHLAWAQDPRAVN